MPGWLQFLLWVCLFIAAIVVAVAFVDRFVRWFIARMDLLAIWWLSNNEEAIEAFKKGMNS